MAMGKGIALQFKNRFHRLQELREQKKVPGETAVLKDGKRFLYYLITKPLSHFQPISHRELKLAIKEMRDHCVLHNVTQLAMPRIGC